jgi:hypothetical protein
MTSRRRLATLLLLSIPLGLACTPSSAAPTPAATADSSAAPPPPAPPPVAGANPAPPPPLAADDETEPAPPAVPYVAPAPPQVRAMVVPPQRGPYRVRIVDASSQDLPTFRQGGRTYVMGTVGSRYSVVVSNPTARRVEAVVSVDGLDAMDGHPANYVEKRGYILAPYGSMSVDGFRTSYDAVATFRFSSVADSYAGRLGQARDVGVIGVAFFPEREEYVPPPPPPVTVYRPEMHPVRRSVPAGPPSASDLAPATKSANAPSLGGLASGGGGGAHASQPAPEERRGLGTEFGEARESRIGSTTFDRANPRTPSQVVAFRYNDRAGLLSLGIPVDPVYPTSDLSLRETAQPFRTNGFAQPPP